MKEVFTKSFWEGVKKTFYDALEDPPTTKDSNSQAPAADNSGAPLTSETPPPSTTSEEK
jgi:hypothetical protein